MSVDSTRNFPSIPDDFEVNLKDKKQVSSAGRGQFFDAEGALLFFEDNALWRISGKDSQKQKIAGGGRRWILVAGDKVPITEIAFRGSLWSGCEVEEGVYWCILDDYALLQVDTKKGEVEAIFVHTAESNDGEILSLKSPPDPATQHSLCMPDIRAPVFVGVRYYCLPAYWLKAWERYVTKPNAPMPTTIQTAPLVSTITEGLVLVKRELVHGLDYELIPESSWKLFVAWYGLKGPEIVRTAIIDSGPLAKVPVHPLRIPLVLFNYPKKAATPHGTPSASDAVRTPYETIFVFSHERIKDVNRKIADKLGEESTKIRLWDFYSPSQLALLDENMTMSEANMWENNTILVEYQHPTSNFLLAANHSFGDEVLIDYLTLHTASNQASLPGTQHDSALNTGRGGFFGANESKNDQNAKINLPRGPLFVMPRPNDTEVFFYDYKKLRSAHLRTRKIRTLDSVTCGFINDPSCLRPSNKSPARYISPSLPRYGDNSGLLTNRRITWNASFGKTFLLDLETGDEAELFHSKLHPILAITSNIVLAVEHEEYKTWIVIVDWSLPPDLSQSTTLLKSSKSRYLLPKERIKRLSQMNDSFGSLGCSYLFRPSNQLYCCAHPNGIFSFQDIFKPLSDPNEGILLGGVDFVGADLSQLLLPECPLPYDLQLTHSASNTSWNVHYHVLNHHENLKKQEDFDRLARVIKNSNLPAASIFSFLKFLYFSPPAELTNANESFIPLCHCVQLCNQIGMNSKSTNYLLWLLEEKIVPKLQVYTLIHNILTLRLAEPDLGPESVSTFSKTSPLMSLLASRCRKYATEAEIESATISFAKSTPTLQVFEMCLSFCLFLSPGSSVTLTKPELSSSAPSMSSQPLKWEENLSVVPRTPPKDKYAYVFTIEGRETGGIICNAQLLYPRWRWFERLCKTKNCQEVQTRHVVLPPEFSPSSLLAILSSCYGTFNPSQILSTIDMAVIYSRAGALHLPEGPCFAELVEICRRTLYSTVNDANCLDKLHEFWAAGFGLDFPIFADALKLVAKNRANITLNGLSKLPPRLRILLSAYLDRDSFATKEDFDVLAAAHDSSVASLQSPS